MKRIAILWLVLVFTQGAKAQMLGGYLLSDRLVSATHSIACLEDDYVLNWPNDSMWVNRVVNDTMTAYFADGWFNHSGFDLLLETGFHPDNYNLRLILSDGSFSSSHTVDVADWTTLVDIDWVYSITDCSSGSLLDGHYILPLDFVTHFGLGGTDEVVGIELIFLATPGNPDVAGIYIIAPPCENTSSQVSVEACASYTSPSGMFVWDTSGSYVDTLLSSEGCDSIVYIGLIIEDTLEAEIGLISGNTLTALIDGDTYQWVECTDFAPIVGAIDQEYIATSTGEYAVIVTVGDCIDTSACIKVVQVSIWDQIADEFKIYPNPVNNQFTLKYKGVQGPDFLTLQNMEGTTIISFTNRGSGQSYFLPNDLPSGVYLLKLKFNDYSIVRKLMLLR